MAHMGNQPTNQPASAICDGRTDGPRLIEDAVVIIRSGPSIFTDDDCCTNQSMPRPAPAARLPPCMADTCRHVILGRHSACRHVISRRPSRHPIRAHRAAMRADARRHESDLMDRYCCIATSLTAHQSQEPSNFSDECFAPRVRHC